MELYGNLFYTVNGELSIKQPNLNAANKNKLTALIEINNEGSLESIKKELHDNSLNNDSVGNREKVLTFLLTEAKSELAKVIRGGKTRRKKRKARRTKKSKRNSRRKR
jgi:hypothetical protein